MKKVLVIFFAIFLLSKNLFAQAPFLRGLLITTIKDTQVFTSASSKSKVVADVPQGTTLFLHQRSPKGSWLLVEDEEGYKAWIATSHTNFAQIRRQQTMPPPPPDEVTSQEGEEKEEQAKKEDIGVSRFAHEFSGIWRRSWVDPNGKYTYGGSYTLYFLRAMWGARKEARAGLQVGYLFNVNEKNQFSVPLRLKYIAESKDSMWVAGPDVGLTFARDSKKDNRYTLTIGYNFGISIGNRIYLTLRPGVDLFNATRFSTEINLGLRL